MTAAAGAAGDWGLYVNECAIFASRTGMDRWIDFTFRAKEERLTMLSMGPGGGEWHVMCGTREAAREAHETFLEVGFHRGHVKVARLSACQAKAREREQRHQPGLAASGAAS
jgi:hypothetical protein